MFSYTKIKIFSYTYFVQLLIKYERDSNILFPNTFNTKTEIKFGTYFIMKKSKKYFEQTSIESKRKELRRIFTVDSYMENSYSCRCLSLKMTM